MIGDEVRGKLLACRNPERAAACRRYFKAFPGGYGEGDVFLGIAMPDLRLLSKELRSVSISDLQGLLRSEVHEERMLALLIMVGRFTRGDEACREEVFRLYMGNVKFINNWDLVDVSAPAIVGGYLLGSDKCLLSELAGSENLWERRIALLSTFHYIKKYDFEPTFALTRRLLKDREDLIHKAAGWMLREVGKRDMEKERRFLDEHYREMPRTMLRYAIERFPVAERLDYLKGRISWVR